MSRQRHTLLVSAQQVATGVGEEYFTGGEGDEFHAGLFLLSVTARTGTLPTLVVFVQLQLPDDTYTDIISFSRIDDEIVVPTKRIAMVTFPTPGSFSEGGQSAKGLSPGGLRNFPLGPRYKVAWNIGGTASPSFTFAVLVDLYG